MPQSILVRLVLLCLNPYWFDLSCYASIHTGSTCLAMPQSILVRLVLLCLNPYWFDLSCYASIHTGSTCLAMPQSILVRLVLLCLNPYWFDLKIHFCVKLIHGKNENVKFLEFLDVALAACISSIFIQSLKILDQLNQPMC